MINHENNKESYFYIPKHLMNLPSFFVYSFFSFHLFGRKHLNLFLSLSLLKCCKKERQKIFRFTSVNPTEPTLFMIDCDEREKQNKKFKDRLKERKRKRKKRE